MTMPFARSQHAHVLSKQVASAVFEKQIEISYRHGEGLASRVVILQDIFLSCRKHLLEYGASRTYIKGSFVAHLFSTEPYHDIDIHTIVDLTGCVGQKALSKGYGVKWAILRGVSDVLEKDCKDDIKPKSFSCSGLENILFEEQNYLFKTKNTHPFNIHTIRFGNPTVEFTCFAVIDPIIEPIRSFDFNSGALEVEITDERTLLMSSQIPDMDKTLEHIAQRKLFTIEPEKIERKAVERYFAKIILSGYTDPSLDLLPALMSHLSTKKRGEGPDAVAKEALDSILSFFRTKNIPDRATLISLWLLKAETLELHSLIKHCREALRAQVDAKETVESKYILSLIEKRSKVELCWYLLIHAKAIQFVEHRNERCLQLCLDLYPLFTADQNDKALYVLFPLKALSPMKEDVDLLPFFQIKERADRSLSIDPQSLNELKRIFSQTLGKKEVFPVLNAVFNRFDIKITKTFYKLFLHWYESDPSFDLIPLPIELINHLLKGSFDDEDFTTHNAVSYLKLMFKYKSIEEIIELDRFQKDPIVSRLFCRLTQADEIRQLDPKKRSEIEEYRRVFIKAFLSNSSRGGEELSSHQKNVLNLIFFLYLKGDLDQIRASEGMQLCIHYQKYELAIKFLTAQIKQEKKLILSDLMPFFLVLARNAPEKLLFLIKAHSKLLKEKKEGDVVAFSLQLIDVLDQEKKLCNEQVATLGGYLLTQEEKEQLTRHIFLAHPKHFGSDIFKALLSRWAIYLPSLVSVDELDLNQLNFLWDLMTKDSPWEDKKSLFLSSLDRGYHELSLKIATVLCNDHPENFFNHLLFNRCFSSFKIYDSFKLASSILSKTADTVESQALTVLLQGLLDSLKAQLLTEGKIDAELIPLIQRLHKHHFIKTMDHPAWQLFWLYSRDDSFDRCLEEWIDESCWPIIVSREENLAYVSRLLSQLQPSPYIFSKILPVLSSSTIEPFQKDFLYKLLEELHTYIWHMPRLPMKISQEHIKHFIEINLTDLLRPIKSVGDVKKVDNALNSLGWCAYYADVKNRELILRELLNLLNHSRQSAIFFTSTGKADLIFMHCFERAIEERKIEEVQTLKAIYSEFFSIEGRRKSLERRDGGLIQENIERIDQRCKIWLSVIGEPIKGSHRVKAENKFENPLLDCFLHYLTDLLVCCSEQTSDDLSLDRDGPHSSKKIDLIIKQTLFQHLDILIKRRHIDCLKSISYFQKVIEFLNSEEKALFIDKFFILSRELISHFHKHSEADTAWPVAFILLNQSVLFLSEIEREKIQGFDERKISAFLIESTSFMSRCCSDKMLENPSMYLISFLQGFLSKKGSIEYLYAWGDSIIERRHIPSFDELSLFSIYVLRLDKGICPAVAYGINKERFTDKHFIDEVFFEKTKTIDMFLSVFEIGFSKFINEIGEKWTPQTFSKVDIFALFNIYCLFLQNGIISKQNTSEFARLQNRIIHFLEFPLSKPTNRLTMLVARTMLNFILISNERGRVSLRYSSKDQLIKLILIFSRCIQLISENIEEFQEYNVNLLILASVFDMHKDIMKKTLSNEDFARLQKNILLFTSFKQSAFVPIKPDQSLPEEATPADILPEEALDPFKDPLYPFITDEIVSAIQDSDLSELLFNGYLEQICVKEEPEEDYVTAYFDALDRSKRH